METREGLNTQITFWASTISTSKAVYYNEYAGLFDYSNERITRAE